MPFTNTQVEGKGGLLSDEEDIPCPPANLCVTSIKNFGAVLEQITELINAP